jgi:hypothetical protein
VIFSLKDLKKADDLRLSSLASYLLDLYEEVKEEREGRINDRNKIQKRIEELEKLVVELEAKVEK